MNPHHAFTDVSWTDLRAEIQRELGKRRTVYPGLVDKGQMLPVEAERQIALFAAVLEDADRFQRARPAAGSGQRPVNPLAIARSHAFTWRDRRAALTRELEQRERTYPRWIDKGQLTPADAERYTRRLACMRALYELGYDWQPANGTAPHFAAIDPTPEEQASRDEWQAIETETAARDGRAQEELAL